MKMQTLIRKLFQPIVIWHEGREKSHLKISGRSKIPSNDVSQRTMPHFLHASGNFSNILISFLRISVHFTFILIFLC